MLKYGIMSCSSIAPRFIAAVREAKAGEIVALSSRTIEKAKEKALLWNVPKAYDSDEKLLSDPEINIVYISTINALHYQSAKAALLAGKHVVCEKPCTICEENTRELYALAKEKGLFFMEAQKMLFLPTIREVKRLIDDGILGKPCMIETTHSFSAKYNAWLFEPNAGGGTLLSSGIYAIELILWLFGEIDEIYWSKSTLKNGAEWQYILCGRTESNILFSALNSTGSTLENRAVVYCEKGKIVISDYWKARKASIIFNDRTKQIEYPCEHELRYEAEHVKQCIENGLISSPVITPELSIRAISLIESLMKG